MPLPGRRQPNYFAQPVAKAYNPTLRDKAAGLLSGLLGSSAQASKVSGGLLDGLAQAYQPSIRKKLYPGEDNYFRQNPGVAGMAAEDGAVILNPYSANSPDQQRAVYDNEAARLYMRERGVPSFSLTPEQEAFLNSNSYRGASSDDRRATIMGRILSGDPSSGQPTPEQINAAEQLRRDLGWPARRK